MACIFTLSQNALFDHIKILSAKGKKISIINTAYTCNLLNFSYLGLNI